jgi:hypothetical protein
VQAARTGVTLADTPDIADGFACSAAIAAAELSVVTGRLETPALIPTVAEPLLGAAS